MNQNKKVKRPVVEALSLALLLTSAGCAASVNNIGTVHLNLSNKDVEAVQLRTDWKGCAEQVVLQTYNHEGSIIDSKAAAAASLGCRLVDDVIAAGSQVGSAALIADGLRHSGSTINNSNDQSQGQGQEQGQKQSQGQIQGQVSRTSVENSNSNTNVNVNSNAASANATSNATSNSSGGGSGGSGGSGGGSHGGS